jgi:hypothetical protein
MTTGEFINLDPVTRTLVFARKLFKDQGAQIEMLIPNVAAELGFGYDVVNPAVTRFSRYIVGVSNLPQRELPRWVIISAFNLAIENKHDDFRED